MEKTSRKAKIPLSEFRVCLVGGMEKWGDGKLVGG